MATSPIPSEKELQDAAYAQAQDAIATARASGASHLTLSGDDFADLAVLPPDIGSLTALKNLNLLGTQVSDISALSGLTALSRLYLSSTPVSDLSPLLPLTQLAEAFSRSTTGLAFKTLRRHRRIPGSPKSPRLGTMPSAPPICLRICNCPGCFACTPVFSRSAVERSTDLTVSSGFR